MAVHLGIEKNVTYATNTIFRNFMSFLIGACDIYAAPSCLEGFGMLDTLVHGKTVLPAKVVRKIVVKHFRDCRYRKPKATKEYPKSIGNTCRKSG